MQVSAAQYSKGSQSLSEVHGIAHKKPDVEIVGVTQRARGLHLSAVSVTLNSPLSSVHNVLIRTMLCSSAEHSVLDVE